MASVYIPDSYDKPLGSGGLPGGGWVDEVTETFLVARFHEVATSAYDQHVFLNCIVKARLRINCQSVRGMPTVFSALHAAMR